VQYSAPEDPVQGSSALRAAAAGAPPEFDAAGAGIAPDTGAALHGAEVEEVVNVPVRVERVPGRNEPCYCGSGKKYKLCHGR
jgi:preprotein translocase subunit SecA